ncbi:hypothetical protein SAMN05216249_10478 [Acetitomaculum ruminis DSM 5522]|uniref:Uncharacterized protein n=1 Tax=Acetitomaculum ruminis DSM 5522 TaxID=1120918 RepID=A0A1I0WHB8_9FIRM|nr:hypothetical protein [Acetitomaculum ruminis]SFA88041.1 hypothetical protein SAMN05216249_10478 [Acetitomaculum ruminis DSM 5522]
MIITKTVPAYRSCITCGHKDTNVNKDYCSKCGTYMYLYSSYYSPKIKKECSSK